MELNEGRGFGWSLPLRGRAPEEIARELLGLRRQVEQIANAYFPEREGYTVEVAGEAALTTGGRGFEGAFEGLRIAVRRGDFDADVEFTCVAPREPGAPAWVRLSGRSQSRALSRARRLGLGASELLRWVMGGFGLLAFASMSSLLLVIPPRFAVETLFVLGGLLMVVVAILTVVIGASFGGWIGDQFSNLLRGRALARLAGDQGHPQDLQRWRALTRQMMARREVIAGDLRRQPFRHDREPWAEPELRGALLGGAPVAVGA
ncbi:MAG: hypothetical protein H6711_06630 [Myxococcales bacterium]|nr:hypothetical protein [Myxococcales bacterium]